MVSSTTRIALVTGGNRGLGQEIARQLATLGMRVIIGARTLAAGEEATQEDMFAGLMVSAKVLDVTRPEQIQIVVKQIVSDYGRIDVLINNAGISDGWQRPSTVDLDAASMVLNVNLLGAWMCAREVIPHMKANGYGRIVNISSRLASMATMDQWQEPAYRISKVALNALTRVLASEVQGTGILVNAASPGWVRTRLGGPNAPRTVEQGADTPVWLATLPENGPTGGFYGDRVLLPW
ncbi:SDR family oxidoreductase [Nonomuraea monospora]|uniref:SDR family oxidoreductase n=1 Tax=Nonomuraea monospora TaxID=568818 RepID=A0ABN3CXH0_9ACTN